MHAILFQVVNRRRIGITFVEVLDPLCDIK